VVEELGGEFGRFELVEGFGLDTGTCQRAATPRGALRVCAEHVRQLEGESPFHNLMEVK
jgi:hypothetical protein